MAITLLDTRSLSDEVRAALRLRAVAAREAGFANDTVAAILGVRAESVARWFGAYERGGLEALPGDRTGRPVGSGRLLSPEEEAQLQAVLLTDSPTEHAIASSLWTRQAVRQLIVQECGRRLPIRTVGEYLRRWGLTPQRPVRHANRQNPEEVRRWLEEEYPALEARAKAEGAEIQWGDETGVCMDTTRQRGYAPPNDPPEQGVSGQRFRVNMVSTITNEGKLRFMLYDGKMTGALFVLFLTRLVAGASRKIILIVDRLKVHAAEEVQVWLYQHRDRLEIVPLPAYAPERNPDEYLNNDVKGNLHRDGPAATHEDLKAKLASFMHRLAQLPEHIQAYFQHPKVTYAATGPTPRL
jgi:transposase